jgi:hypothetical protein
MPSENYRYYCLDGAGHLHSAEWFAAESEADAIAQIETKHPDAICEIWQGKRLVAKLSPKRRSA